MPGEWSTVELQEVADVNSESLGADTSQAFTFKYIDISSVTKGVVNWNTIQQIVFRTAPSRARRILRKDDFLLCTVRPGLEAHTAAPWAIRENFVASTGFAVIRSHRDLNPRFLAQLAFSPLVANQLRAREVGSNYPAVTERDVRQLSLPLPPLPEQRRIAEVLDTLDTVIERTEALVQKLKLARAGLLHDLLTRGLDEQGQLRDPERHPEEFKNTELGRVPREWEVVSIDALAIYVGSGVTPPGGSEVYQDSGVTFIRSQNVTFDGLKLSDVAHINLRTHENMSRSSVKDYDVLLNITGASIGRCCWVPSNFGIANVNQHVCIIRQPQASLDNAHYLTEVLSSPIGQMQIERLNAGGNREGLNFRQLRSFLIPWPSEGERQKAVQVMRENKARIVSEQLQLDKLRLLKRGLVEDLLTGRVRVPMPEERVEDDDARAAVRPMPVPPTHPAMPDMPPPIPVAAQSPAMYRASPGASPAAQGAWVEQVRAAVAGQQIGTYSLEAFDTLLPELAALSAEPEGILRVPELLASIGIRFMLLAHPTNSRTSGAAFYLDEPTRTQPVVALSFLRPYLDAFWFNLFHELGHIRLGHAPVLDEELGGKGYAESDEEQAANAFARHVLIPEVVWQPFLAAGLHDPYRIRSFARRVGRHHGMVAGRLGNDTGDWPKFNSPELRPQVKLLLTKLAVRIGNTK